MIGSVVGGKLDLMETKIWEATDGYVQASSGTVYYFHAQGAATPEAVRSMVVNFERFVDGSPDPIGYIFEVGTGSSPPTAADRAQITAAFNRHAPKIGGLAIVINATGFIGAVQRASTNAVFAMHREGFDTKTFDTIRRAVEWIAQKQSTPAPQIFELIDVANVGRPGCAASNA
jgi:hypothetical protein